MTSKWYALVSAVANQRVTVRQIFLVFLIWYRSLRLFGDQYIFLFHIQAQLLVDLTFCWHTQARQFV